MYWEISVTILGLAVLLLTVFAVPVLIQIRRTARKADQVLEHVNQEMPAILNDLRQTSANIRSATQAARSVSKQISAVVEEYQTIKGQVAKVGSRLGSPFSAPAFGGLLPAGKGLAFAFGFIRAIGYLRSRKR
jgi:peptidoglycan hydrolase CwlO-like protein